MSNISKYSIGSMIALTFLIGSLFVMNTEIKADLGRADDSSFDEFNIDTITVDGCGCHNAGSTVIFGSGYIIIEGPNAVSPGQEFEVSVRVQGFTNKASEAITIGFNINDGNNSLFMNVTQALANHDIDASGNSEEYYNATFTAPSIEGQYKIYAMAVGADAGGETVFDYVIGIDYIIVTESIGGSNTSTTTKTSSVDPQKSSEEIRKKNQTDFIILVSLGFILNVVLLTIIFIYSKR
ncbi:MAG: hypothetical protein ACXAC7_20195 [Candidatus Hodarchaeales archaeon]|jgi:hypothetical protein